MKSLFASVILLCSLLGTLCAKPKPASQKLVSSCLSRYVQSIKGFPSPEYLDALNAHLKDLENPAPLKAVNSRIVVDLGLGSHGSDQVFNHLIQLNISGVSSRGDGYSCRVNKVQAKAGVNASFIEQITKAKNSLAAIDVRSFKHNKRHLSWLEIVDSHPSALFLVNDVTDGEYFDRQFYGVCANPLVRATFGVFCGLPWIELPDVQLEHVRLSKVTFKQAQPLIAAYRDLVKCVVPPKQKYEFNLNQTTADKYFRGLTGFLGLKVPEVRLKHLIEGGLSASPHSTETCTTKAGCGPSYLEVVPNVCEDPASYVRPKGMDERLAKCAATYIDQFIKMVGEKYRTPVTEAMQFSLTYPRKASSATERLILGVGPGTSGTKSLHYAAVQLNITGRHWVLTNVNCRTSRNKDVGIDVEMDALHRDLSERPIFWADTPVSDVWWNLYRLYPNTKMIMTDVRNESDWRRKRAADHGMANATSWYGNNIPVPFVLQDSYPMREISKIIHLSRVSEANLVKGWNMYRDLLRCAVPKEQLHWLFVLEARDAQAFWTDLIDFLGFPIKPRVKTNLIAGGIPIVGSHTCIVGGHNCTYYTPALITPNTCGTTNLPPKL